MGFLKKVAGFLGFSNHESHDEIEGEADHHHHHHNRSANREDPHRDHDQYQRSNLPRKGFSVPVQVAVDKPVIGPILIPCSHGDGGVQGLKWYAKRLRIDEDGDVADEFLDEVMQATSLGIENHHKRPQSRFEVKYSARPAKVKKQVMSLTGKIQQCVEHQGRLQWV